MAPDSQMSVRSPRPVTPGGVPVDGTAEPTGTDHPVSAQPIEATAAHCDRCDAVCCRLTVVLMPGDDIPVHMTDVTDKGLPIMARDEDGWCVAVDSARMCCSIYEIRPQICRGFTMNGPYCQAVREDYTRFYPRDIALTLV